MPNIYLQLYKSPCLNCKDRAPGCHSSCDAYMKYRQRIDKAADGKATALMLSDAKWSSLNRKRGK